MNEPFAEWSAPALGRHLEEHLPGFRELRAIRKIPGGQSNPTYLLTAESGSYVLRRKPFGVLLKSAHAVDREFKVLEALQGSQVPVPRPLLLCDDPAIIGSVFYVMEYVPGRTLWDPLIPDVDRATRHRIYEEMNRVLAALHDLNVERVGLGDFGRPGNYFERQIRRWTDQYRASETERRPAMETLIEWLPANVPPDDAQVSVVHGDYRLDNLIFDEAGRAVALLDWELSTLGHPYSDLAYQCAQWRLPASLRGLKGVDRESLGIPSEEAYVAQYLERRGLQGARAIPHWNFYLVVSLFRLAAICQGVYQRSLQGNSSSPEAADFGSRTAAIAAEAVGILQECA